MRGPATRHHFCRVFFATDAKVGELRDPRLSQEDVVAFEVAVEYRRVVGMEGEEPSRDIDDDRQPSLLLKRKERKRKRERKEEEKKNK